MERAGVITLDLSLGGESDGAFEAMTIFDEPASIIRYFVPSVR
jgi:hypothetical protein